MRLSLPSSRPVSLAVLLVALVPLVLILGLLLHAMPWMVSHSVSNAAGALAAFLSARRGASSWISTLVGLAAASVVVLALQLVAPSGDLVLALADALGSALVAIVTTLALLRYARLDARRPQALGSRHAPQ